MSIRAQEESEQMGTLVSRSHRRFDQQIETTNLRGGQPCPLRVFFPHEIPSVMARPRLARTSPMKSTAPLSISWRRMKALVLAVFLVALSPWARAEDDKGHWRVLDPASHLLGLAGQRERQDFEGKTPEGESLEIKFDARANAQPATLLIRQRDVKHKWPVALNGRVLGALARDENNAQVATFTVPPGALRAGENILSIRSPQAADDIFVGDIKLDGRAPEQALHEATVRVQVTEKGGGPIPCRLTIVDADGYLAPIHAPADQPLAVRVGAIYTGDGRAEFGVPAGRYTIYATRGFEYGVDERKVSVAAGDLAEVALQIAHEVPTPGFIACDPHIHTLTLSGHGDATLDERALTLAGEGVELAIATEHNRFADYSEAARKMKVDRYFTCAIGNEVTTDAGHFIAFSAARADAPTPDPKLTDWPALMTGMRAVPGVQVVLLNHPRDIHKGFIPFGEGNFNPATGDNLRGPAFDFDAVEVANSGTLQTDFMRSYRDWFALLNRGQRVTAVGSSDSHDVARLIVGQGRSYVACEDAAPGRIDVAAATRNFKAGRVAVSLGLLTRLTVDEKFQPGDLATPVGREMTAAVTVLGPSWTQADKVELFANGVKIREQSIHAPAGAIVKASIEWKIARPAHDVHLVAIASGPGVTAPYWPIPAPSPYQPAGRVRNSKVIGSTNPVWVDSDGDGHFTAARHYAQTLIQRLGPDPAKLIPALVAYDEAVAVQAAGLGHAAGRDPRAPAFVTALGTAAEQVKTGFATFAATLPPENQPAQ